MPRTASRYRAPWPGDCQPLAAYRFPARRQNSVMPWNRELEIHRGCVGNSTLRRVTREHSCPNSSSPLLAVIRLFCQSRSDTALEVLALRQQVAVLKRKRPRPVLNPLDRLFWTTLRHFWCRSSDVLVSVKPKTVINWHRAGFRLF